MGQIREELTHEEQSTSSIKDMKRINPHEDGMDEDSFMDKMSFVNSAQLDSRNKSDSAYAFPDASKFAHIQLPQHFDNEDDHQSKTTRPLKITDDEFSLKEKTSDGQHAVKKSLKAELAWKIGGAL